MQSCRKLMIVAALAVTASSANAATVTATLTDDGTVQTFGGDSVVTDSDRIFVVQSGGLIRNGVLEFDLGAVPDTATIDGATLSFTLVAPVSNTGGNPAAIDLFAFGGDGAVTLDDFDAAGVQVFDGTTPFSGAAGDVRSFAFTDTAPIASALGADLLTIRVETDSFASVQFASLENAAFGPASLSIDFTPAPPPSAVPLPAGLPLLMAGLGGLALLRRRR